MNLNYIWINVCLLSGYAFGKNPAFRKTKGMISCSVFLFNFKTLISHFFGSLSMFLIGKFSKYFYISRSNFFIYFEIHNFSVNSSYWSDMQQLNILDTCCLYWWLLSWQREKRCLWGYRSLLGSRSPEVLFDYRDYLLVEFINFYHNWIFIFIWFLWYSYCILINNKCCFS